MDERAVVSALVFDVSQRLLLVKNEKWQGQFALPTRPVKPGSESLTAAALAAVRADTGLSLPNATARLVGYAGLAGVSGRTGETTLYQQWAVEVDPGERLRLPGDRVRFEDCQSLQAASDVAWTSKEVAAAVLAEQEVAVAVVTRPGREQTEYLVLWSDQYEGYFFPAGRVTQELGPAVVASAVVRVELGYTGEVVADLKAEVPEFHFRPRWGRPRAYRFHIVAVDLPGCDPHRPLAPLDRSLRAREADRLPPAEGGPAGWSWRWLTADQLRNPPEDLTHSPTMDAVVPTVLAVVPPTVREKPLRHSEGGVAVIRRAGRSGRPEWLAQWNEGWGAFFLIGGHREPDESFGDCVVREVHEELELDPGAFTAGDPLARLHFVAPSCRAVELTEYDQHLYPVSLSAAARQQIDAEERRLGLRWLSAAEVRRQEAEDGRRVSETVELLLELSGQLPR
jgi:8-oxo-dGTP pyrophosphatase MutT (NUDIX family)